MFELLEHISHLPAERERVIKLMMSFNEALVAASHYPVQPAHAFICIYKEDNGLAVYIYLYLEKDKAGLFYKYSEEIQASGSSTLAEDDAVQFTEDMGFLMDDLKFGTLDASQQDKLLATIPVFNPQERNQEEKAEEVVESANTESIETPLTATYQTEILEKLSLSQNAPVAAPVAVDQKAAEQKPEDERKLEKKTEEAPWEPEIFLSKFRMRAAAERLKKNKS